MQKGWVNTYIYEWNVLNVDDRGYVLGFGLKVE